MHKLEEFIAKNQYIKELENEGWFWIIIGVGLLTILILSLK